MAAVIGFLMIIAIVVLLLKGKMSPIVVLAVVPAIAALILRFSPVEIMGFIADGIKTTTSNGILFMFEQTVGILRIGWGIAAWRGRIATRNKT